MCIRDRPTLDSIIRLCRIIDRPVWQATADQPVCIVAAARLTLPRHRLAARLNAAHMRTDGAAQTLGVARSICVHICEVVELFRGKAALEAVALRRQCQRDTVAPPSANLG